MYILTLASNENEGAFAIEDEYGDNVLMIFEEYDDAERYISMLDELDYPEMEITEVERETVIIACETFNYEYVIITPNDLVVPPNYDKISKNSI
jgi:hypothetical protein